MHRTILPVIALLLTALASAQVIELPVNETWRPYPEWSPYDRADVYSAEKGEGYTSFKASGGKGVMVWVHTFAPPLDIKGLRYVTFRYRLTDTDPKLFSYTVYFADKDAGGMLARNLIFGAENLQHDGQWHTARTTLQDFDSLQTVALRLRAVEGQQGRLDVAWLRVSAAPLKSTLSETISVQPGQQGRGRPMPVPVATPLVDVKKALDLEDWFPQEQVTAQDINFTVPTSGAAALSTPDEPRQPVTLPFTATGQTLYLLIGSRFLPQMLSYAGWEPGDMTDRAEQFTVAVQYQSGKLEEHVPYCLAQGRHGMWRGMHVYALPLLAGQQPQQLRLNDGMRTAAFHLVALAVGDPALPALAEPVLVRTPRTPTVVATVGQELTPNEVVLRTQRGVIRLDLSSGIKLSHASPASLQTRSGPLFSVSEDRRTWGSDTFRITERKLGKFGPVELTCVQDEAQVEAKLVIDSMDEVWMRLSVRNLADKPRTLNVVFPQVQLTATNADDLTYFIPNQCAIWSNRDGAYESPYSGVLPVQWQDAYNRRAGGGLYVATRDLDLRQRYFQLVKSGKTLTQRIEYRFNPPIGPGETVTYPATVIALHDGDWRASWAAYQAWLRRWYKPDKPRLPWFRDVWNFRTWWTHTMGEDIPRFLEYNLVHRQTGAYQTDMFVKRDREQLGDIDMVHFFDWRISKQYGLWGDYSHYEDLGGLEKFRAMIKDLHSRGIRVGLYLDAYLCSRKSLVGQAHGEEWAIHGQDGNVRTGYSQPDDPMLNMCVNHPGWQDYLAQTCARVARETGCDGIYIDEGMTDLPQYWCWRKDHGHPVPGVNQPGLLAMCQKIKAALPANVALYTEWVPADIMIPHLDGGYQAGLRLAEPLVSPGFLQTARFAFPDFRVLTISNGGSMYDGIWEGMKYSLFSGVPLYSLSWGHDEECLPIFRRYSDILHRYGQAFNTANPRPFIDTEAAEVYANEFPAAKTTVWTLWNGRYRTCVGPVLKVKHMAGAKYVDVWTGKPLQPRIVGGNAVLQMTLGPRGIGVIAQIRK